VRRVAADHPYPEFLEADRGALAANDRAHATAGGSGGLDEPAAEKTAGAEDDERGVW
jgi:hypothetical protein